MRTSTFAAFTIAAVVGFSVAACNCGGGGGGPDSGDDSGFNPDGGCINSGFGCSITSGSTACCNGAVCETNGGGTSGTCGAAQCKDPGQSCQVPGDCCGGHNCINGICSTSTCTATGAACTSGTECCTTLCNQTCQSIPGQGSSCKILGEPCVPNPDGGSGTGGCCSGVCSGGACSPQFSCRASNDICTDNSQCCSLICNKTQADGGGVGTCVNPSGATSCGVSGDPCDPAGSKCCTLACTNLGTGTTICQPTLGCRVQGDTCAAVGDCCGLTANATCSTNRCTNGTACRPAGDLCGKPTVIFPDGGIACAPNGTGGCFTTTSETNCCNGNKVGGMETVCRVDQGGIPRCFGGQSGQCPYGYTGVAPCCIQAGNYCDFRDECCNGAICAAGADGGRQCLTSTCKVTGTSCAGTSECCTGLQCLPGSEIGTFCQPPQTQPDGGAADGGCGLGNGSACTSASQCCSRICDATGHCGVPNQCSGSGGACAGSGDCCAGLVCNLPAGSTNGTCVVPDGGNSCLNTGQTCTVGGGACCAGLTCVNPATYLSCDGTTSCACEVVLN